MPVDSFHFLGFAAIVIVGYNLFSALLWRQAVLLTASLCFLATFSTDPLSYVPLVGFLALGYIGTICMQRGWRRAFVWFVVGTVLVYIWLKQYSFLPSASFIRYPYLTIGLSYIFFRVLHLIIESGDGRLPERVGIVPYLNYTLNFTTLVSGPIQDYSDFAQMHLAANPEGFSAPAVGEALERVIVGFFKISILSWLLIMAHYREIASLAVSQTFFAKVLTGTAVAVCYPLYLYYNFSGYTDMVIGVARFLRIRLPENFNRPFSSDNFINFWSRWHITLSEWLKRYVFNPLLLSSMRRFPSRAAEPFWGVFAFFVTFFLIGVWHGRTSVFIVFGVLQGLGVSMNKLYQILMARVLGRKRYKELSQNPVYDAFARGLTFCWFAFSLFWFWSNWAQMSQMFHYTGFLVISVVWTIVFFAATLLLALLEFIRGWALSLMWNGEPIVLSRYTRTVWNTALITISTAVVLLASTPAPDIVYKRF